MSFTIQFTQEKEVLRVSPAGDLDINSSPELKISVLDEYQKEPKNLVFDLEKLEYLDSTGLGAFISIFKNLKEENHSITIVNAKPNIRKLFTITELDRIFRLED